jgi:hypothetical protein
VILEVAILDVRPGQSMAFEAAFLLEHHTEGFRKSTQYLEWKQLLHHFYDPFPVVEHYYSVL